MLSNQYIGAIILNALLRMLAHVFTFSSDLLWMDGFASFLRHCCLILKHNIYLGHLVDQVSCRAKNKSFLKHLKCMFSFKSFKINAKIN